MVKLSFTLDGGLMDLISSFSKKEKTCFQTATEFAVMDSWTIEGSTGCYWFLNYLAVSVATHGMDATTVKTEMTGMENKHNYLSIRTSSACRVSHHHYNTTLEYEFCALITTKEARHMNYLFLQRVTRRFGI